MIVKSLNETPEAEINERLENEFSDYRIVSATTAMAPVGEMNIDFPDMKFDGVARHMYYATTVVLEKN